MSADSGRVLASELGTEEEILARAEQLLSEAGRKGRTQPARVQVTDPALAGVLEDLLAPHGVEVETRAELPELREILDDLVNTMVPDDDRPSPLTGAGVTVERLAAFARAAAELYASSTWHHLTTDDLVRIEAPGVEERFQYFFLGRRISWPAPGLLFFADTKDLEAVAEGEVEWIVEKREGLWSIEFERLWNVPLADADLWERHGLPGVEEDRIPVACLLGFGSPRRPDRRQLAFLEGLLSALAATTEEEIDTGRWEKRVSTAEGPVRFVLSLPDLLAPEEELRAQPSMLWSFTERSMRQIGKLLSGREFASLDEANALLASLAEQLPSGELSTAPETPEERAQALLDRAYELRGRRVVLLARQALEIWPDCADAYGLLAARASDPEAARELFAQAVAAGKRALGIGMFAEAGHFWGLLETRPYMRALQGLAESLIELERFAEAAGHFLEMLRLNPNDNQGVRHSLVNVLIVLDRDVEAGELLDRYGEDLSALMVFPRVLLRFRREGDSLAARRCLKRALQTNRFVPGLLLGRREFPPLPEMFSPGSEDEAMVYLVSSCRTWESTPGALDWLRERTAASARPKAKAKHRKKKRRR